MSASEADIREGLAAYLRDAAEAVKGGLTTERRYRQLRGINRKQRLDIMGQDLYYLEVLPTEIGLDDVDPSRFARDRVYSYNVALHHRYEDADTYAAASQSTWDPIAQAVIEAVAERSFIPPEGGYTERLDLTLDAGATPDIQPLDERYQDIVHTLSMTLTCTV